MHIKIIIFDLDGTLIDAYGAIASSLKYVLKKFNLDIPSEIKIKRAVGWGDRELLKQFVPADCLNKALKIYRNDHRAALLEKSRLMPYAGGLLPALKRRHIKLAVASNRPTEFSLSVLKHLRIKDYFDYVLCADKLKFKKPHPLILNKIMNRFKFKKENALYVGDMSIDARAANSAGIKAAIVLGGSSTKKEIEKERPFMILKDLRSLVKLIDANI
ncbi:MAG: hypothetical protein COV72_09355 [Candidatus Omnitrophica bacterium CG11_big_fil_rev_8_21_14_0_20_42_13]|uniref:phosphoglycolate phosphatase n=1 Tax=Candidatus Ghiorseimicrobium undicola TaxID=1974746 RepID=A0A2H0LV46_9BACT|nr:MAG: hypothetical protein COV72_09355 [Candidatus Omnitrophica bacterium CG11_big_fil_rev_8_21_14_0_20_42_13]